jgi:hypothetical protein
MISLSVLCLNIAHPGMVFGREERPVAELSYQGHGGVHGGVHGGYVDPKYPTSSSE